MKNLKKGISVIETSIVTAIVSLGLTTASVVVPDTLEQAEQTVSSFNPEELQNPFGDVSEDQEEQAALILSRAVGDPELEAMAREVESDEDLEALRVAVLNKYHYVSAPAREARALAMMSRYD